MSLPISHRTAAAGGAALLLLLFKYASSTSRSSRFYSPDRVGTLISGGDQAQDIEVQGEEYDFIIVGGGTAALVLANRLSTSPNVKVLVLEAGQSGADLSFSTTPLLWPFIMRTQHDWNFRTTPQPSLGDRELAWTRTKLLGGCSSANAMMFHFGAPEDYDQWAEQSGSSDWSYAAMKKYFLRFEKFVPHPEVKISTAERGKNGPVEIGYFGLFTRLGKAFLQACESVGIPQVDDVNTSAGTLGVTRTQTYINSQGQRVSTETAYLTPDVLARPNLKVTTNAQVTRVRFSIEGGIKRAVGVEFSPKKGGPVYYAKARGEVLLSAGTTNTPHLLMVSGVGPSPELAKHGIPIVHDLPGIGQHLTDHAIMTTNFRTRPGYTFGKYQKPTSLIEYLTLVKYIVQYKLFGTGILSLHSQECMAFARTSDTKLFPPSEYSTDYEDTTSAKGAPDIEVMVSPLAWRDHGFGEFVGGEVMSISPTLLRPNSRGTVTLRSSDPFDKPIIDPQYLSTKHDREFFRRAAKLCWRIGRSEALAPILDENDTTPEMDYDLDKLSVEELDKIINQRIETLFHPTSTTRMVPLAEGGVVDPQLRVYGIQGLRVVDAGVMPTIVSGHTAAPTIAIGEKAADMIKDAWPSLYPSHKS